MAEQLSVRALEPGDEREWQAFLQASSNGTLFHDLEFLDYHPPGRFRFHHLVVRNADQIVAVVPGGLMAGDDGDRWRSPLGASIGGPVLGKRPRLDDTLAIVEALQQHAQSKHWGSIELTLPPVVYHPAIGDQIGFAVFGRGFRERRRWLSPMIDVSAAPSSSPAGEALFEKRQVQALRAAWRQGGVAVEAGAECLDQFAPLFEATYERLGVRPTHTIQEIDVLLRRFPERVRLVLAREGADVTAGLLVMWLTRDVATTFYICRSPEHLNSSGAIVAVAALADGMRERECRWLDLGPSASNETRNAGVMLFKEGLGGVGYCRTEWAWKVQSY